MRLLLAEDDTELSSSLHVRLKREGFAVDVASNGVDAEFMGDEEPYDAVILDLGLPQRNGLEVLRHWRQCGNLVPVLILTARDAWHERVDGFKAGADDYLGKPFHVEELLVRILALIRRNHQVSGQDSTLQCCGLLLDEAHQQVRTAAGTSFDLTGTEFRLLRYFMLHSGKILTKSRLTEHVYEQDFDRDSNVIEVYVRHLRRKLGEGLGMGGKHPQRFKWLFPILATGGIVLILGIQGMVIRRTFHRLDHIRNELQQKGR